MVTIPGTTEKGLVAAAAFGFVRRDAKRRSRVIEGLTDKDIIRAGQFMEQKNRIKPKKESKSLDIEVNFITDRKKVKVIILVGLF